jgi:very-short-patch-repair endonuclease
MSGKAMIYKGAYKRKPKKAEVVKIPRPPSKGEALFDLHCRAYDLQPEREWRVCSDRLWRFDFAWPDRKIAVEVEGGTEWGRSRHSKGKGFEQDAEKYNRAARDGWIVLRFTTRMVLAGIAIDEVLKVLNGG